MNAWFVDDNTSACFLVVSCYCTDASILLIQILWNIEIYEIKNFCKCDHCNMEISHFPKVK